MPGVKAPSTWCQQTFLRVKKEGLKKNHGYVRKKKSAVTQGVWACSVAGGKIDDSVMILKAQSC